MSHLPARDYEEHPCQGCEAAIPNYEPCERDAAGYWCMECVAKNPHVEAADPFKRAEDMWKVATYLFATGKTARAVALMTAVVGIYAAIQRPGSDEHVAIRALASMKDRARREASHGNHAA